MTIKKIITQYTWLLVLLAMVFGWFWPQIGIIFKPYLTYLLMALMVFTAFDISLDKIVSNLPGWERHLVVVAIVHLVSPLIVFLLRPWLSDEIFLGLILAATSTAGLTSIFLSKIYGGLPSEALVVVSISTALSPITIPWLAWLFARTTVSVDPWQMTMTILQLILIPLIISSFIRHSRFYEPVKKYGNYLAVFFLVMIIFSMIASIRQTILNNISLTIWLFLLISILVIIDFYLAYSFGKKYKEKITYALAASYKNYALASVLSLSLFGAVAALPATVYALVNNLLLVPFQLIFLPAIKPHRRHWYFLWLK